MFECTVEMNDGSGWRAVFTASFASEYGSEKACDFVFVRRDLSEMILRETVNPSGEEPHPLEDHGGCNPAPVSIEPFAWWKSTDGGATWSTRDEHSEPDSREYLKLEVAG
jgi:hypothetical protein